MSNKPSNSNSNKNSLISAIDDTLDSIEDQQQSLKDSIIEVSKSSKKTDGINLENLESVVLGKTSCILDILQNKITQVAYNMVDSPDMLMGLSQIVTAFNASTKNLVDYKKLVEKTKLDEKKFALQAAKSLEKKKDAEQVQQSNAGVFLTREQILSMMETKSLNQLKTDSEEAIELSSENVK